MRVMARAARRIQPNDNRVLLIRDRLILNQLPHHYYEARPARKVPGRLGRPMMNMS